MENINTISIRCDHFGSPFSVSDSWFRIRPIGSDTWHSLSKNEVYTLTADCELQFGFGSCLLKGTMITMFDNTRIPIENIRVGDMVKGRDNKPKRVIKSQYGQRNFNSNYAIWKIETPNGITEIKTTFKHEFYNETKNKMCYLTYEEEVKNKFEIGDNFINENGELCKLISYEVKNEACQHFSIWCEDNLYYANGLLSGNRHSKLN